MEQQRRNIGLDVIRGVSAILIMLYHYTSRYIDLNAPVLGITERKFNLSWGCYAVITFFFISGYLSSRNVVVHTHPQTFLLKRFKRLYPTFWVAMLFTTCVLLISGYESVSLRDFLFNLTMTPMIFGAQPIDGVYWTQQYELIFFFFIFVALFFDKIKAIKVFSLIWLLFSVGFFFIQTQGDNIWIKFFRVFAIPNYCAVFIAGMQIRFFEINENRLLTVITLMLCLAAFAIWQGTEQLFFFLLVIVAVTYVIFNKRSILNRYNWFTKFFAFIASISYPLYLIHQKVGYVIMNKIVTRLHLTTELIIVIPIVVSIAIAYLLHKLVECKI